MRFPIAIVCLLILAGACSPKPKPIEYGADACAYCKMTIVDKQHAAEAVTTKGKVYKFDAIECMINFSQQEKEMEFAYQLVNSFTEPGEMKAVSETTFLISKNLPSPMGAYLSAFSQRETAEKMQREKGGELYDWASLKAYFDGRRRDGGR